MNKTIIGLFLALAVFMNALIVGAAYIATGSKVDTQAATSTRIERNSYRICSRANGSNALILALLAQGTTKEGRSAYRLAQKTVPILDCSENLQAAPVKPLSTATQDSFVRYVASNGGVPLTCAGTYWKGTNVYDVNKLVARTAQCEAQLKGDSNG